MAKSIRGIVKAKGLKVRTRVRNSEGESVTMQGMPETYDGAGLVNLALGQREPVKAKIAPEDAVAGATTTAELLPADAADAVAALCDVLAPAPTK